MDTIHNRGFEIVPGTSPNFDPGLYRIAVQNPQVFYIPVDNRFRQPVATPDNFYFVQKNKLQSRKLKIHQSII